MPLGPFRDASEATLVLSAVPRRIVSLVPSITEILFALGVGDAVAGCTIYCTEPAEGVAAKARVGGEKNPALDAIRALGADLVIANVEENLREHVEALRGWGIPVYVTYPRTVAEGIRLVRELGVLTGAAERGAAIAAALESDLARTLGARGAGPRPRVFCPIWRRPYMAVGGDTYANDMLSVCGGDNVFAGATGRYPTVTLEEVAAAAPDVILLPDEPYRFRAVHREDFAAFPTMPAVRDGRLPLIDGKLLSWYGPRIGTALRELGALLR